MDLRGRTAARAASAVSAGALSPRTLGTLLLALLVAALPCSAGSNALAADAGGRRTRASERDLYYGTAATPAAAPALASTASSAPTTTTSAPTIAGSHRPAQPQGYNQQQTPLSIADENYIYQQNYMRRLQQQQQQGENQLYRQQQFRQQSLQQLDQLQQPRAEGGLAFSSVSSFNNELLPSQAAAEPGPPQHPHHNVGQTTTDATPGGSLGLGGPAASSEGSELARRAGAQTGLTDRSNASAQPGPAATGGFGSGGFGPIVVANLPTESHHDNLLSHGPSTKASPATFVPTAVPSTSLAPTVHNDSGSGFTAIEARTYGFSPSQTQQGFGPIYPQVQSAHQNQYLPNKIHNAPSSQLYTHSNQQHTPSNQQYTPSNQQYTPSNQQYTPSNQQYTSSNQQHTPSNQQHTPSNQQHTSSNQQYSSSNQQHTPSNQQHTSSNQQYTPSNQQHTSSNQQYTSSNQQYTSSNQEYTPSNQQYTPSNQQYTHGSQSLHNQLYTNTQQDQPTLSNNLAIQQSAFSSIKPQAFSINGVNPSGQQQSPSTPANQPTPFSSAGGQVPPVQTAVTPAASSAQAETQPVSPDEQPALPVASTPLPFSPALGPSSPSSSSSSPQSPSWSPISNAGSTTSGRAAYWFSPPSTVGDYNVAFHFDGVANDLSPRGGQQRQRPSEGIPRTNFTCRGKKQGYYADLETNCQVFHICQHAGLKSSFMCPEGSVFNQQLLVCDWWFDTICERPPESAVTVAPATTVAQTTDPDRPRNDLAGGASAYQRHPGGIFATIQPNEINVGLNPSTAPPPAAPAGRSLSLSEPLYQSMRLILNDGSTPPATTPAPRPFTARYEAPSTPTPGPQAPTPFTGESWVSSSNSPSPPSAQFTAEQQPWTSPSSEPWQPSPSTSVPSEPPSVFTNQPWSPSQKPSTVPQPFAPFSGAQPQPPFQQEGPFQMHPLSDQDRNFPAVTPPAPADYASYAAAPAERLFHQGGVGAPLSNALDVELQPPFVGAPSSLGPPTPDPPYVGYAVTPGYSSIATNRPLSLVAANGTAQTTSASDVSNASGVVLAFNGENGLSAEAAVVAENKASEILLAHVQTANEVFDTTTRAEQAAQQASAESAEESERPVWSSSTALPSTVTTATEVPANLARYSGRQIPFGVRIRNLKRRHRGS